MMYKGGKNHIKPADFLNFYMSKKGGRGRWKSKGISKFGEVREYVCEKVNIFVLMVCVFEKSTRDENQRYTCECSRRKARWGRTVR